MCERQNKSLVICLFLFLCCRICSNSPQNVPICRVLLRLTNALLALLGLAMLGYAVYMYFKFNNTDFPSGGGDTPSPTPGPSPPPPPSHKLSFPWCELNPSAVYYAQACLPRAATAVLGLVCWQLAVCSALMWPQPLITLRRQRR
jgi:hypothetical protein